MTGPTWATDSVTHVATASAVQVVGADLRDYLEKVREPEHNLPVVKACAELLAYGESVLLNQVPRDRAVLDTTMTRI